MSSNDHDESPHVPVIRNSRNSNTTGDANVKARQARLARDLSSSRYVINRRKIQNYSFSQQIRGKEGARVLHSLSYIIY